MWARRCGAPPVWPSRVKVFLLSIGTGALGLTIYTFMARGNVGYLDLSRPSTNPVMCLDKWPSYTELPELLSWFDQQSWGEWLEYRTTGAEYYLKRHATCKAPALETHATCASISVPLHKLMSSLGSPLDLEPQNEQSSGLLQILTTRDILSIYAHLFLVLSIGLWLAISFHDHALLHSTSKDFILDAIGLRGYFPRFKKAACCLMGLRVIRSLLSCRSRYLRVMAAVLVVILTPILLVWRLLTFMFVVCPLASLIFLCYPIRTSRLWTFLICIASTVYGVCLSAHMCYFLGAPEYRPRYAVTWQAGSCTCGCVYPISQTTCGHLLMIGLLATVKASVIAVRTLKGLRRNNWANLLSVTFAVPVNAYSVEWTKPDGKPITNRKAGEAVQSEPAFDPFALMDEQPHSANSHVTLTPSDVLSREADKGSGTVWRRHSKRQLLGPSLPSLHSLEVEEIEEVGCCGFPYLTGAMRGRLKLQEAESKDSRGDPQDGGSACDCGCSSNTEEPAGSPSGTLGDPTPASMAEATSPMSTPPSPASNLEREAGPP